MAISPNCTVNTFQTDDGVDVTGGSTVTIQLESIAGVYAWSIQCINTDDVNTKEGINLILSIDNGTKTATFTAPLVPNGSAIIFESKVNNGRDSNGRVDSALTTRFGVFVLTGGGNRLFAFDERMESNATFGWLKKMNDLVRDSVISIGGLAGVGLYFSGGMYNVGAANDSITINADSIELKSTYKTLLDGATNLNIINTLAKRSSDGSINFQNVNADGNVTAVGNVLGNQLIVNDSVAGNIFVARKHSVLATTVDITALNSYAISIVTQDQPTINSKTISISTGNVSGNGIASGSLTQKTGNSTVGTGTSGAYIAGSGSTVNGNAGSAILSAGSASGSGSGGTLNVLGGTSVSGTGGNALMAAGNGNVGGSVLVRGGSTSVGAVKGGAVSLLPGTGQTTAFNGNMYLGIDGSTFSLPVQSTHGGGTIYLRTFTALPTAAPSGGCVIWFDGVNMWIRKPGAVAQVWI